MTVALRMEEILIDLAEQANKEYDDLSATLSSSGPGASPRVPSPLGLAPTPAASSPSAGTVTFALPPSSGNSRQLWELDEHQLAERALEMACAETEGKAWARGASALKMGEIILIVDSDTQVRDGVRGIMDNVLTLVLQAPEDCLRDAAREMAESPEVAIIQHVSGEFISTWKLCISR